MLEVKSKIDLSKLNDSQIEAVLSVHGVVQCNSVAGSGKTTVLTNRVAHMVQNCGINPDNMLVATFTKNAAEEMKERLVKLIGKEKVNNLTIGTFHSIGYRILKHEYTLLDDPMKDFQLLNGAPVKWLIKEILQALKIKESDSVNQAVFEYDINKMKMELISPDQCTVKFLLGTVTDYERDLYQVYEQYEVIKSERKLIDFNDMLYRVYFLFIEHPEILAKYQNRFEYILCDEAQDCNKAQYELLKMLGEPQNNIFIVGDDDQSLYKFRGAKPEEFINFKDGYDEVKMLKLQENYRSLPVILETANKLIEKNQIRIVKKLLPFRKNYVNKNIDCFVAGNEEDEAKVIAKKIIELKKEKKSYNDIAVLYRVNSQSRALEEELVVNGIPYEIRNGISFFERSEIKDVLAYLQLGFNNNNDKALERIINKPSRYLGKAFMDNLREVAKIKRCSLFEALKYINVSGRTIQNVNDFGATIKDISNIINTSKRLGIDVGYVLGDIVGITKYENYLKGEGDEEDNIQMDNVSSLIKLGSKFKDIGEFLKHIDSIVNSNKSTSEKVKLMTIHRSKGLEFNNVFVCGISEGLLPHKYAINDADTSCIEEERRLAYVAITRAKDYLHLTSISTYQYKHLSESRFLSDAGLKVIRV